MKKSTGIFVGCGGLLIVGIIVGAILGFIGYRNMNPNPSVEDVPEIAGRFKKDRLNNSSGSLLSTTEAFTAQYSSTEGGKKAALTYLLSNLADKVTAVQMMDRLPCDYEVKKGIVKDKAGKEIGIYRVCDISEPTFQMTNDNRSLAVMPSTDKSPISLSDIENFVTSLSFNSNVDFADLNIGFADLGVADRPKATPAAPASNGEVLNAFELAKQHEKSKESVSKYNDKEIMIRGYIKFPPTINNPSDGGLAPLGEKTATIEGQLKSIKCWSGPEDAGAFSALKGEQYVTVKGIFSGQYLAELRYCKLVKAE